MSDKHDYVNWILKMGNEASTTILPGSLDEDFLIERALPVRARVLLIANRIGEKIMAKKAAVVSKASISTVLPKPEPSSKVLTVRLPTQIVDALNKHKQEKNVELSAIVRPILEKTLMPTGVPLIENVAVAAQQVPAATPAELPDWMGPWGRMFFAS